MTVDGSSNARHYSMDTSSGDFSISVTDEETDLRVGFNNNLNLPII